MSTSFAVVVQVHSRPLPLPQLQSLNRHVNCQRQQTRPKDPTSLGFHLEEEFVNSVVPNFTRADITVDNQRHLVFATDQQLHLLVQAKTWYLDATFKVVKEPFYQLFSIHSFVKTEDRHTQVPLVFVLMSRRKKKDYKAILQRILDMLPSLRVREVIMDFERGMWCAVRAVLPETVQRGCAFHWGQAVWRKVQACGLQTAYCQRTASYDLLKKVLSLPYMPVELIPHLYASLQLQNVPGLEDFHAYMQDTWIGPSSTWHPQDWCVFNMAIRTNNDVEGWHRRLNHSAGKASLPLYLLIQLLGEELQLMKLQVRLLSQKKLTRHMRKNTATFQGRLFAVWDRISTGEVSGKTALRKVSQMLSDF